VNKEIVVLNRKLQKVVKSVGNMQMVQSNLNRDDFTRHGMHLNLYGKGKVAKLIGESIIQLTANKKQTPFISKWREDLTNHQQKEAQNQQANDVNRGTKPETALSPVSHEETQAQARKRQLTTTTDQINIPPRTSNRINKTPATMNEDFLWLTRPQTRVHQQPIQ